jgi:hypothetical protein
VQYKDNQNVITTTPIQLNMAYSIGWSGVETEMRFQDGGQRQKNIDHHNAS